MLVITTILFTFVKLTVSVNYWDIRWGQGAGRNKYLIILNNTSVYLIIMKSTYFSLSNNNEVNILQSI